MFSTELDYLLKLTKFVYKMNLITGNILTVPTSTSVSVELFNIHKSVGFLYISEWARK